LILPSFHSMRMSYQREPILLPNIALAYCEGTFKSQILKENLALSHLAYTVLLHVQSILQSLQTCLTAELC